LLIYPSHSLDSEQELNEMMNLVDADGDGEIDFSFEDIFNISYLVLILVVVEFCS